jgi:hypothetical protein
MLPADLYRMPLSDFHHVAFLTPAKNRAVPDLPKVVAMLTANEPVQRVSGVNAMYRAILSRIPSNSFMK